MKTKKLEHLSKIFHEYYAFIVDLWGVMHNGIKLNASAINAVKKLEANGKRVFFLSNAPRPTKKVVEFLKKMKMDEKLLKNVLTSGEAAMNSLKKNRGFQFLGELHFSKFVSVMKNLEEKSISKHLEKKDLWV